MTVFKREGSSKWQVEFVFRGSTFRKSSGTDRRDLAEEFEQRWKDELYKEDQLGGLRAMSVSDACTMYWNTVIVPGAKNNLKSTAKSHKSRLLIIGAYFGAETPIRDIANAAAISGWKASMLSRGLTPASVDRNLDMLRAILYRARDEWQVLRTVPNIGKIKLNENNDRVRFLEPAEEVRLLAECLRIDQDLHDTVAFLIDTGGRRADALQLEWQDVSLDRRMVSFLKTKEDRPRGVPMTNRVAAILEARHAARKTARVFPYDPNTLAKPGSRKGSRGAPTLDSEPGFRSGWSRAVEKAGIIDLHVHDLRHTFASRLVSKGVPLYTVGELLGHRDPKTTARYSHLQPRAHAEAVAVLNLG